MNNLTDKNTDQNSSGNRESILVTGGAGFIGSHVVEALLKRQKKVILIDLFNIETTTTDEKQNNVSSLQKLAAGINQNLSADAPKAELVVVKGDVRDRSLLQEIINNESYNITSAIHTAGMVDDRRSVSYPNEYFEVNLIGTATLLDELGKSGKVKRVVQASTRSVFGEVDEPDTVLHEGSPRRPVNPYGVSKVASDAVAHCYSHIYQMQVFLVRITSCYGPKGRPDMILRILMENIKNGQIIKKYGSGEATRTWLYIDDLIDCFMRAYFYGTPDSHIDKSIPIHELSLYEEFNTGSDEGAVTLNQVIATAEKVMGKKANIQEFPVPPKGDAKFIGVLDFSKARNILGWSPKYNLEQGMTKLKAYYEGLN